MKRDGSLLLLLIIILIGNVSCRSRPPLLPENNLDSGWHKGDLLHNKKKRVFRFYIPNKLPKKPAVVILLHGGTRSMDELFRKNSGGTKQWPKLAEQEGFLLLVPNGTNVKNGAPTGNNQQWNDYRSIGSTADDVGFINKLILWAQEKIEIDKSRIYITGSSNGGMMTYRLARELSGKIAAVAVFIANKPKAEHSQNPDKPMPILIVNGTGDPLMPFEGGNVSHVNRGEVLSAKATVNYWVTQNNLASLSISTDTLPNLSTKDNSYIIRKIYGEKSNTAPVIFFKIVGGGHFMPSIENVVPHWTEQFLGAQNNDLEGAVLAWKFFSQFTN